MRVVVVDQKGPKVNGYFTLATEILDDSGAPHTLEHLVFMGSKNYKYKGLLDKLASRAYGSTNAWTATDHTAYTLETAGWEGFAQTLPVYLEHLIKPTLTDEACLTEVHHIDGEGNDAGVVYSEMQGVQFTSTELMDLKARRLLYPPNVGFRYETGGMMDALRVLTADRIREFHKDMYTPRNMCLIIIGEVDHANLLQILDEFEETVKDDFPPASQPFKRPWVDSEQTPPLAKTVIETIEFPEEDESTGDMAVAYLGPNCVDGTATAAVEVLLTYLAGSSVSILENVIVEKEELASSVAFWWDPRPDSVIWFQPTGVATEKLEFVEKRLIDLLREVSEAPLDMAYMKECIQRERRQIKAMAESSETFYSQNIITDYLFGRRDGSTLQELESLKEYDILETWSDDEWRAFLKKWIVDAHHVSVLGKPSQKLADQLKADEVARIEKRKQELGPEGLAQRKKLLEDAKKKNEIEIPASVLQRWQVPPTSSIHFIDAKTARSGLARKLGSPENAAQKVIDAAAAGNKPLFLQFESVPTNFVHINIHVGTVKVPTKLKPLIPLLNDYFFNAPINRDGKRVEFEQVVMELERDTVNYSFESGSRFGDTESILVKMQVEPEKYAKAVEWIRTMMFDSIFDITRLKATVSKQLADIPESKRDGRAMASEIEMAIHNEASAYLVSKRALVKAVYLRRLKRRLQEEPDMVVSWFEELRRSLFQFANVRALVTADVEQGKISEPVKTWDQLAEALDQTGGSDSNTPVVKPYSLLNAEGRKPGSIGAVIVPITSIDSSFSISTSKGLTSFNDPAVPALLVAAQYLETVEGPLWNAVRGNGLAYGAYFGKEVDGGYVHFKTYRSPMAAKAIMAARDTIKALADGTTPLEKPMVEGAISQIVMTMADEQSTMAMAAVQNFVSSVIRGLEPDFNQKLLAKIRGVTEDQIRKAIADWLLPAFYPESSNVVVTCAPIMVEASTRMASDERTLLTRNNRTSKRSSRRWDTRRKSSSCRNTTTPADSRPRKARRNRRQRKKTKRTSRAPKPAPSRRKIRATGGHGGFLADDRSAIWSEFLDTSVYL